MPTLDADLLQQALFLVGPTASGKSAVALHWAQLRPLEIVALDSMTLYKGMDIGTAKPTPNDQAAVPHHLLDILDPWQDFSVAEYLAAAEMAIKNILQRGRIPLFVGGSGLYLRSILRGITDGPSADWGFRQHLESRASREGPHALYAELARIDPDTAARLPPEDLRRVIRALEVFHLTGVPFSQRPQNPVLPAAQQPRLVAWLSHPPGQLASRIDARIVEMWNQGWCEETSRIRDQDPRGFGKTASQALGYREILNWLEAGRPVAESTLLTEIQTRTRQFAKRQRTWFRNLEECRPLPLSVSESPEAIAATLDNWAFSSV